MTFGNLRDSIVDPFNDPSWILFIVWERDSSLRSLVLKDDVRLLGRFGWVVSDKRKPPPRARLKRTDPTNQGRTGESAAGVPV